MEWLFDYWEKNKKISRGIKSAHGPIHAVAREDTSHSDIGRMMGAGTASVRGKPKRGATE